MLSKQTYFITCTILTFCDAFSVNNLPRCSVRDSYCQKYLYRVIITEIGSRGIPEIGIPSIDPMVLKNVSVAVLEVVNITLVDGILTGVKDCAINKFEIDMEKKIGSQEITCDVTLKGHYTLFSNSQLLRSLLGDGGIHGEGKGKAKLKQLFIKWKFPFYPERHKDGEIYFKCIYRDVKYNFDVKGKASFAADSIYLGKENISQFIISYMNANWKFVMRTFGKTFIDIAKAYYVDFSHKFFGSIPAKYFILEDLTPYLI